MKPKPFVPETYPDDKRIVRDRTTGLAWHRAECRVLYADTDRAQIVYHANYLRYFELGRTSLMRDFAYPYKEIEDSGYTYPIYDLGVTFFQSLVYDDLMYIYTRPVNLERVRLQFDYVITNAEKGYEVCRGFTKHCAANAAGRPVAVDPKTVRLWQNFPKTI